MITIILTEEEAEVVDNYIFRKACRLEEANLKDSKCYPALMSAHHKIVKEKAKNTLQSKSNTL